MGGGRGVVPLRIMRIHVSNLTGVFVSTVHLLICRLLPLSLMVSWFIVGYKGMLTHGAFLITP